MPLTVAIVEDDSGLRATLESVINSLPGLRVVATFRTAEETLAGLPQPPPQVVLIDYRLPRMSGADLIRVLRTRYAGLRTLVWTEHGDEASVLDVVRAGADGYALKRGGLVQLEAGLRAVARGERFFSPSVAGHLADFVRRTEVPPPLEGEYGLTHREVQVLELARQGFDAKRIARDLGCSYATVRTHFDHIRAKLKVVTRAEAVARFFRW